MSHTFYAQSLSAAPAVPSSAGFFYYDTNGDGALSPLDALRVINRLNAAPPFGEGEDRLVVDASAAMNVPYAEVDRPGRGAIDRTLDRSHLANSVDQAILELQGSAYEQLDQDDLNLNRRDDLTGTGEENDLLLGLSRDENSIRLIDLAFEEL